MSNFICGKTLDGREVILDVRRVESFTNIVTFPSLDTDIVEVIFKSGQVARMVSVEQKDGESLWAQLVAVTQLESLPSEFKGSLTDFTKIDGSYGLFDRSTVEFLISWKQRETVNGKETEYAELYFSSGKTFTVFADSLDTGDDNVNDNSVVDVFIGKRKRESGEIVR